MTDPTPKRNLVKERPILKNLDGSHPEENYGWKDRWAWGSGPGGDHVRSSRGEVDFTGSGGETPIFIQKGKREGIFQEK